MKAENMKHVLVFILLVGVIIAAGCVGGNKNTGVTPTLTPTPTVIPTVTTTPQMTVGSTPSQPYKNADIIFGVNPDYGFRMDYPSNWTYTKEDNYAWVFSSEGVGGNCGWSPGYSFSSSDKKSHVFVSWANKGDLLFCLEPLDTWADECVKSMIQNPYCHDGAGNRMGCTPSEKNFYHMNFISNEMVNLSGNVVARKLVFTSYDDKYVGWDTFYLFYTGRIQGYNRTVPNRNSPFVEVNGPVWDCGKGGIRYAIYLYTPKDQVNATSEIFNHMINSFEVTTKL